MSRAIHYEFADGDCSTSRNFINKPNDLVFLCGVRPDWTIIEINALFIFLNWYLMFISVNHSSLKAYPSKWNGNFLHSCNWDQRVNQILIQKYPSIYLWNFYSAGKSFLLEVKQNRTNMTFFVWFILRNYVFTIELLFEISFILSELGLKQLSNYSRLSKSHDTLKIIYSCWQRFCWQRDLGFPGRQTKNKDFASKNDISLL